MTGLGAYLPFLPFPAGGMAAAVWVVGQWRSM